MLGLGALNVMFLVLAGGASEAQIRPPRPHQKRGIVAARRSLNYGPLPPFSLQGVLAGSSLCR